MAPVKRLTRRKAKKMYTHFCLRCRRNFQSQIDDPARCTNRDCGSLVWDTEPGAKSTLRRGNVGKNERNR